jgi:hypothetical protein
MAVPFTEKDIMEKMEVVRYWAKQIETLEGHSSKVVTPELKDAYGLVYNDYKWKILLAIRDLYTWFCATETKMPTYLAEKKSAPEESKPPTENSA